jgi:hypothetical protein
MDLDCRSGLGKFDEVGYLVENCFVPDHNARAHRQTVVDYTREPHHSSVGAIRRRRYAEHPDATESRCSIATDLNRFREFWLCLGPPSVTEASSAGWGSLVETVPSDVAPHPGSTQSRQRSHGAFMVSGSIGCYTDAEGEQQIRRGRPRTAVDPTDAARPVDCAPSGRLLEDGSTTVSILSLVSVVEYDIAEGVTGRVGIENEVALRTPVSEFSTVKAVVARSPRTTLC